jgi:hypothetical protein
MKKNAPTALRDQARNWTCQNLAITEHDGNAATLLRKAAEAIEELGNIEILDIAFKRPIHPPALELTVSVYFYFPDETKSVLPVKNQKPGRQQASRGRDRSTTKRAAHSR